MNLCHHPKAEKSQKIWYPKCFKGLLYTKETVIVHAKKNNELLFHTIYWHQKKQNRLFIRDSGQECFKMYSVLIHSMIKLTISKYALLKAWKVKEKEKEAICHKYALIYLHAVKMHSSKMWMQKVRPRPATTLGAGQKYLNLHSKVWRMTIFLSRKAIYWLRFYLSVCIFVSPKIPILKS